LNSSNPTYLHPVSATVIRWAQGRAFEGDQKRFEASHGDGTPNLSVVGVAMRVKVPDFVASLRSTLTPLASTKHGFQYGSAGVFWAEWQGQGFGLVTRRRGAKSDQTRSEG
jgi:hypothetical protein